MTQSTFLFDVAPAGTTLTAANTGFNGAPVTGSSTMVSDQTHAVAGYAAKITAPSGASGQFVKSGFSSSGLAVRAAFYLTSRPASDTWLLVFYNGANRLATARINAAGALRLDNAVASSSIWTDTALFPINQWVYLNLYVAAGTTGSDGTIRVTLDTGDASAPISDSGIMTGQNTGTLGAITSFNIGKSNAGTFADSFWLDSVTMDDAATNIIVPNALTLSGVVTPTPATVGNTLTLTLTATGGNANPKSYSCVWDGTSMGPQSSNVFVHTDTTAGTKNWSATVTQSA